jgi:hypothetical protein
MGCRAGQGFHFARSLPAARFEELLRRGPRFPVPAGSDTADGVASEPAAAASPTAGDAVASDAG